MYLSQQDLIRWRIEVVKKVGDQHEVITGAKVDIESTTRNSLISVSDACLRRILFCNFNDGSPVKRGDFSLSIFRSESQSVQTVSGGNIENLQRTISGWIDQVGHQLRRHRHHRSH